MVKKSASKKPGGFHMESLENRELMAGDVAVSVTNGNMYIGEAPGSYQTANSVWVQQLSSGQIRVQGLANAAGGQTLVNGRAYQDFSVSGDLSVNLGAGNDTLYLYGGSFRNVGVQMNQVGAAADADNVFVRDTRTTGNMSVSTGGGNDLVDLYHASIGDAKSDYLSVSTGTGADTVRMSGYTASRGAIFAQTYDGAEVDADVVDIKETIAYGSLGVYTGGGADSVSLTGGTAGDDVIVATGDGADTVKLREVQAIDDFYVILGTGNDKLDMTYLRADHLSIDGGTGTDVLTRSLDGPVNSQSITGFEPALASFYYTMPTTTFATRAV